MATHKTYRGLTAAIIIFAAIILTSLFLDAQKLTFSNNTVTAAKIVSDSALVITVVFSFLFVLKTEKKNLPALTASLIMAVIASYTIKFLFGVERPNDKKEIMFTNLNDYSFPSSHTTFVFAPLYALSKSKVAFGLWLAYGLIVAASRVILGAHTPGQTAAGAILGFLIGMYLTRNSKFELGKDIFEVKRQTVHLILGLGIAILYGAALVNAQIIALVLAAGILLSAISQKHDIPLISFLLDHFERGTERKKFPGKGAIMLVAGSLISIILFPKDIALASIAIMALGDSFSHIIGRFFGRTKQPFSVKLVEGTMAGIMAGFLGAIYFVPVKEAAIAATIAMTAEAFEISISKFRIDDNILIPLVSGTTIFILRLF